MQTAEELVAGPALDARVAREVMGWTVIQVTYARIGGWLPSTDIGAAFQVVEHMRERWHGRLRVTVVADASGYQCDLVALTGHGRQGYAEAETAPLAICLAALKAVSTT